MLAEKPAELLAEMTNASLMLKNTLPRADTRTTASVVSPPASHGPAEPPLETADIPGPGPAPGARHLAAPATREVSEGADPTAAADPDQRRPPPAFSNPMPTHAVARPVINARSGPGTENQAVARLPEGRRLAMIEEHDGWGRFLVLDGDGRGQEVSAALRILKAMP